MTYLIFILVLTFGSFAAHCLSKKLIGKLPSATGTYLANIGIFLLFFYAYFFLVGVVEYEIYGSSSMYDVELLIFLAFGLGASIKSSACIRRQGVRPLDPKPNAFCFACAK